MVVFPTTPVVLEEPRCPAPVREGRDRGRRAKRAVLVAVARRIRSKEASRITQVAAVVVVGRRVQLVALAVLVVVDVAAGRVESAVFPARSTLEVAEVAARTRRPRR